MSGFIKTITSDDFFKDFEIESPADIIDNKTEELEDIKNDSKTKVEEDKEDNEIKSLEDLKKELEGDNKAPEDKEDKEDKESKEDTKEEDKEEDKTEYSFKPFIDIMAEQGILDLAENAEIGDTAEDLVEVFESTVNNRVANGIEEYKESIPDLGKQFLEYLEQGGDPKKFIQAQAGPLDLGNIDLTEESNQKLVIKELLKAQDYSNDEIKEILQDYEDGLLLEKQAKIAVKKLEVIQSKYAEKLVKEQAEEVKKREKELNDYISDIQKIIKESKDIAGLEVAEKDKKEFEAYLFKRDKAGLTQYQKDLNENPNKTQVELAYLKFKKYDFAKAAKKGENTAAQKIREKILKTETTVQGITANQEVKAGDFSAFKKVLENMRK